MLITSGGLTKVLQQLETRGLITRTTSDADRRSKPAHLSPAGVTLIERAMSELVTVMSAAVKERLSEKEIRDLVKLLNKARLA
jgi:DNA-binding MarR family transcriptional regulator